MFTQGEWTANYKSGGDYEISSSEFVGWIAKVNTDCYSVKANALLIAAAPDMYKALKKCVAQLNKTPYAFKYGKGIEAGDKALAKAEGK